MKFAGYFRSRMESRQKMLAMNYRSIPFHAIAILQLISSFIVLEIMLYFVTKLRGSHMPVPYTFVINLTVAIISTVAVGLITSVYAPDTPRPRESIILNSVLLGLWVICFAVFTNSMTTTIMSACTTDNWGTSTGVMVCNLYKAVFYFEIIALLTTALALVMNCRVHHSTASAAYFRIETPKFSNLPYSDDDSRRRLAPLHQSGSDLETE